VRRQFHLVNFNCAPGLSVDITPLSDVRFVLSLAQGKKQKEKEERGKAEHTLSPAANLSSPKSVDHL
jgi:hypothetical protein